MDPSDHNGHMTASLKDSKSHLSVLVERAAQGEEVIITVCGKPKACLCPLPKRDTESSSWGHELREAREKHSTGSNDSSSEIMDDLHSL